MALKSKSLEVLGLNTALAPGSRPTTSAPEAVRLLRMAVGQQLEGALNSGFDLPVGAVAAVGSKVIGRGYSRDALFGRADLHAERIAIEDAMESFYGVPDLMMISFEPCESCQDFLADTGIEAVGFGLSYADVARKGIIRNRDSDIFDRASETGLPYTVFRVDDQVSRLAGLAIFDHVSRTPSTIPVTIDQAGLRETFFGSNFQGAVVPVSA